MARRAPPRSALPVRAILIAAVLAAAATAAPAQLLETEQQPTVMLQPPPPIVTGVQSAFQRGREVAVTDRSLPEFSAHGVSAGVVDLYPAMAIGGVFSSDILANRDRKHAAAGIMVRPEITLRTESGLYNFSLRAVGDLRRYASQHSEDSNEGLAEAKGQVAVGALSNVYAGVSYGTLIEPRYASDSPANGAEPLRYTALLGNVGGSVESGRFRILARGDLSRYRFSDLLLTDGTTQLTADRNRERYQGMLRVEYALTPALSVYTSGMANKIDYQRGFGTVPLDRDSTGWGAFVGSSFDLGHLVRGDVRIGYIEQNFRTPGVPKVAGLGALGVVSYFPNGLSTITLRGESTVQDTGVPGTTGVLHRGGSAQLDQELRRYLIASVQGGFFRDVYRGAVRRDNLPFARASGTYLSAGHWNARVMYEFRKRDCNCTGFVAPFTDNRLLTTLTLQL